MAATVAKAFGRYFHFAMALLLAAAAWYGFRQTIEENLFHPSFPRPLALYLHAAAFSAWIVLYVVQTFLVAVARKSAWHRRLGWAGLILGYAMPVLGVAAALRMTHLRAALGDVDDVAFLVLALWDMAAFAVLFHLAMTWRRRRPEAHRRLLFLATCGITTAALTRFPPWLPSAPNAVWPYYAYVDALMLLGALRDRIVLRRVHPVYLWAIPILMAGQAVGNAIYMTRAPLWMHLARWLIR